MDPSPGDTMKLGQRPTPAGFEGDARTTSYRRSSALVISAAVTVPATATTLTSWRIMAFCPLRASPRRTSSS